MLPLKIIIMERLKTDITAHKREINAQRFLPSPKISNVCVLYLETCFIVYFTKEKCNWNIYVFHYTYLL